MSAFTVAGPYKVITGANTTDNTVTIVNPGSSLRQKVTVTPIAGPIAFAMNETAVLGTTGGLAAAASLTAREHVQSAQAIAMQHIAAL